MKEARLAVKRKDKKEAKKQYDEAIKQLKAMKSKVKNIPDDDAFENVFFAWLFKGLLWELIDNIVNVARGGNDKNISRTQASHYIDSMISQAEKERDSKLKSLNETTSFDYSIFRQD